MTRPSRATVLATALAAMASAAFAAPVTIEQILTDKEIQLGGMDYDKAVDLTVDAAIVQTNPAGVNEQDGNDNVQENRSVLVPEAESDLQQTLTNNSFNTDPADLPSPLMHNAVNLDVSSSDEIIADVGVNAAAGAFNLQLNASVVAVGGDLLSQSAGDLRQDAQWNAVVIQDAINDVTSTIVVDEVIANVGINAVSGVGNAQLNSFTLTTP